MRTRGRDAATMPKTLLRPCLPASLFACFSLAVLVQTCVLPLGAESEKPAPASSSAADAYAASGEIAGPASAFHREVALHYNYAFGKNAPFLPSNATSANGQFMDPNSFSGAQYCGHCHKESYHQWRQSVHSNAFRAQWYRRNVNTLIDEKGVQYSRHCEGCHNPLALLSGSLSQEMPAQRPFEQEGVTCSACHSIQSVDTTGTGSYVMGVPAVLVDENGAPIKRPVSDAGQAIQRRELTDCGHDPGRRLQLVEVAVADPHGQDDEGVPAEKGVDVVVLERPDPRGGNAARLAGRLRVGHVPRMGTGCRRSCRRHSSG